MHRDIAEGARVPSSVRGGGRGSEETEGQDCGGRLGAATAEEAQQRDAEVPDEAEGHQRDGDVGDEPAGIADDLKYAEVLAVLRAAEARLEEGQAGMAERLVHRDIEGEGARTFLKRHVAGEALGCLGSRILLVGELIQQHREGNVVAGPTERELVGLASVFKGLRIERFREIEIKGPDTERLFLRLEFDDRGRRVGLVVVIAFRERLVGQLSTGADSLGRLEVDAVAHLRFGPDHRVRVVGLDDERVRSARELDVGRSLLGGDVAEDRIRNHDNAFGGAGFLDERDLEIAEGFGVITLLAFGDDHRGLFLVDRGDEAAAQQKE